MAKEINAKLNKNDVRLADSALTDEDIKNFHDKSLVVLKKDNNVVKIEFTWRMLAIVALAVVLFFYSAEIAKVVAILFFALILTSTVIPAYHFLLKKKVKKGLAIFIVYFGIVIILVSLVALVVIPFVTEFSRLIDQLPTLSTQVLKWSENAQLPFLSGEQEVVKQSLNTYLQKFSKDLTADVRPFLSTGFDTLWTAVSSLIALLGGIVTLLTVFTISIYLLVDHDYLLDRYLLAFVESTKRNVVKKLTADVEWKLGRWVWGEILLMLVIGFLNWIVLTIFRVPFALPLAVMAGLLEIIPSVGPIVAGVFASCFALVSGGPVTGLLVGVGAFAIQQLENNFIVPKIMSNAVDVRPLVLIVGMLFGYAFGGIMGGLVAVPLLGIAKIFYDFYYDIQRLEAKAGSVSPIKQDRFVRSE